MTERIWKTEEEREAAEATEREALGQLEAGLKIRAGINGTLDAAGLRRLRWPLAWSGLEADRGSAEAALASLAREGLDLLVSVPDAREVEIAAGEIVAVLSVSGDDGPNSRDRGRGRRGT